MFLIWMPSCKFFVDLHIHLLSLVEISQSLTTIFVTACNYYSFVIDYLWTFLQLILVLVIFATTLQLVCNYHGFHLKKTTYVSLVINVTNFVAALWIQRCILCIIRGIVGYIKIYKCIFWMYMNGHITSLSKVFFYTFWNYYKWNYYY
jgi:hypothetical protein